MVKNTSKRIVSDPRILGGKPIVRGTRISVEYILELLHSGMSIEDILKEYKHLSGADLRDAIAFAKKSVARQQSVPIKLSYA